MLIEGSGGSSRGLVGEHQPDEPMGLNGIDPANDDEDRPRGAISAGRCPVVHSLKRVGSAALALGAQWARATRPAPPTRLR
jgi:hypothetical protein